MQSGKNFIIKGMGSTIALFIFSAGAFAQEQDIIHDHRWLLSMKRELDLTKLQVNKLTGIDKYITAKMYSFEHRYTKKTAAKKTKDLFNQQRKNILAVLTPEQQTRGIMILDQTPRRGVTDMPNERTVKQ